MNYKNLSDNDIVKVFECCYADKPCSECPLYKNYECTVPMEYSEQLPKMIVNLIKRLKSENEVLQHKNSSYNSESLIEHKAHIQVEEMIVCADSLKEWLDFCDKEKADVIKEFTDLLKKKSYAFPCAIGFENAVTIRAIDDTTKEFLKTNEV